MEPTKCLGFESSRFKNDKVLKNALSSARAFQSVGNNGISLFFNLDLLFRLTYFRRPLGTNGYIHHLVWIELAKDGRVVIDAARSRFIM